MIKQRMSRTGSQTERRGVAATEFAVMAPLFLTICLGIMEFGSGFNASTKLTSAIREGGRLAAMDYTGKIAGTHTANSKVEQDIRNFLTASGIPGDECIITITHADGGSAGDTFDLEDTDNYLERFRIKVEVPYESISMFPLRYLGGTTIGASIIYRKGRVSTTT